MAHIFPLAVYSEAPVKRFIYGNSFVEMYNVVILHAVGVKRRRGAPEVLSSLYPSFWTSWDLGAAPAVAVLASRN